jgi:Fe-S-cluster containining protein
MAEIDSAENGSVDFLCGKCGECCRHIEAFLEIIPHQHDGICDFLQGNLCLRYETRPDLCDYERAYKYFEKYWTKNEYRKKVTDSCEKLIERKP